MGGSHTEEKEAVLFELKNAAKRILKASEAVKNSIEDRIDAIRAIDNGLTKGLRELETFWEKASVHCPSYRRC